MPRRSAYGREYRQGHGLCGAHRRTGKKRRRRPGHQFSPGRAIPAWSSNSQLENKGFSLANVTVDENGISLGQSGKAPFPIPGRKGRSCKTASPLIATWFWGNGAADGWDTASDFSISLGNSSFYGTLNINEAYIKWGDAILYSLDMSANAEKPAYGIYLRQ